MKKKPLRVVLTYTTEEYEGEQVRVGSWAGVACDQRGGGTFMALQHRYVDSAILACGHEVTPGEEKGRGYFKRGVPMRMRCEGCALLAEGELPPGPGPQILEDALQAERALRGEGMGGQEIRESKFIPLEKAIVCPNAAGVDAKTWRRLVAGEDISKKTWAALGLKVWPWPNDLTGAEGRAWDERRPSTWESLVDVNK